jgi:hypothetical protein
MGVNLDTVRDQELSSPLQSAIIILNHYACFPLADRMIAAAQTARICARPFAGIKVAGARNGSRVQVPSFIGLGYMSRIILRVLSNLLHSQIRRWPRWETGSPAATLQHTWTPSLPPMASVSHLHEPASSFGCS